MEFREEFQRLAIALGLGLIVGLQREWTGQPLAGIRTFPLVTMFGALAAMLSVEHGGWVLGAGVVATAALMVVGNLPPREEKPGITTETAMLVMYLVGALAMSGELAIAAMTGGSVAVLLHLKPQMHSVAHRFKDPDIKAIMQFVLITLVILPVLPNKNYGPYLVLNPHKIWLMVVLIVGISLGAFIIYKFFGSKVGTIAGGVLGGLISSTATTVSYSRKTTSTPEASGTAALVIMVASTIVFARVLIIISAVAPSLLAQAVTPISIMIAVMGSISLIFWRLCDRETSTLPPQGNPSELKAALVFAGLYALILLAVAAAKSRFGNQGLYVVSVLSGLTDMDAISLSISEMFRRQELAPATAWRLILVAALSNLVFKTATVAVLGHRKLLVIISLLFGISLAVGIGLVLFWP